MARSKEYQKGEKAGREAGREAGRRECLDFLRNKDAELSRKLEEWLLDRGREKSNEKKSWDQKEWEMEVESLAMLRFNINQSQVDFLQRFFYGLVSSRFS